jgi:Flp pilus assembly pilin Flp
VGASAVEYSLIATAIAAVIVAVVMVLGHYVHGTYSGTCSSLSTAGMVTAAGDDGTCT